MKSLILSSNLVLTAFLCLNILTHFSCLQTSKFSTNQATKMNQLINNQIQEQQGLKEEIVFVPTPIDQNLYENMTKSGKHKVISNDFMLKQLNLEGSAKSVAIPSEDFSEEILHNFGKYQKIYAKWCRSRSSLPSWSSCFRCCWSH